MEVAVVLGLSLAAGWAVNVIADALPAGYSLHRCWQQPWMDVAHLLYRRQAADDAGHPWRALLAWGAALALGWLAYVQAGLGAETLVVALYAWFFLAVAIIDLEHRRVLNRMLLAALPFVASVSLLLGMPSPASAIAGGVIGAGFFLTVALLRPGGMGMGDVKLAGLIGLATGISGAVIALIVGIVAGGLAGLGILVHRRFDRQATMAYAPYLAIGAWVALYFGVELWQAYFANPGSPPA